MPPEVSSLTVEQALRKIKKFIDSSNKGHTLSVYYEKLWRVSVLGLCSIEELHLVEALRLVVFTINQEAEKEGFIYRNEYK